MFSMSPILSEYKKQDYPIGVKVIYFARERRNHTFAQHHISYLTLKKVQIIATWKYGKKSLWLSATKKHTQADVNSRRRRQSSGAMQWYIINFHGLFLLKDEKGHSATYIGRVHGRSSITRASNNQYYGCHRDQPRLQNWASGTLKHNQKDSKGNCEGQSPLGHGSGMQVNF